MAEINDKSGATRVPWTRGNQLSAMTPICAGSGSEGSASTTGPPIRAGGRRRRRRLARRLTPGRGAAWALTGTPWIRPKEIRRS